MHTQITLLSDITSACTLPSDMAIGDAASILVKLYILRGQEHLLGGGV